jgi:imidazolonepropionase-like amidohydrolase
MGAADEIGRLEPGKLADIVIVTGDPLADITDLFAIEGVMLNGRYRTLEQLLR